MSHSLTGIPLLVDIYEVNANLQQFTVQFRGKLQNIQLLQYLGLPLIPIFYLGFRITTKFKIEKETYNR